MTLAYVFWHRPRPEVDHADYERRIVEFHEALVGAGSPGFLASVVFRLPAVPWLPGGDVVYEDWYLVSGSAALDPLDRAAVTAARKAVHDRAARAAAAGVAGLYRLRRDDGAPTGARVALWLHKPAGSTYEAFYDMLEPAMAAGGLGLWGRQMVLGPTAEFCLHVGAEAGPLPVPVVDRVPLELVWHGSPPA